MTAKIFIVGAGAWGTALAEVFGRAGREVVLYARDKNLGDVLNRNHQNPVYLPSISLHEKIMATSDISAAKNADIILLATPTQFLRETLKKLKPYLLKNVPLVNGAKGIEISTGSLIADIVREEAPGHPYATLSGPTFAVEVARGLPTAVTLATTIAGEQARILAETLSGKTFRPYLSDDPVGADVAGAVKNVIAIACGIVEGKKLGQNAKAAVMTRGMAEIRRLGLALGATSETFLGLSGIGDLTLTCNSVSSRNFSLGLALGQGRALTEILAERKSVAEGVTTAKAIAALCEKKKIDMPISLAVNDILHHGKNIDDAVRGLLSRDLKMEGV